MTVCGWRRRQSRQIRYPDTRFYSVGQEPTKASRGLGHQVLDHIVFSTPVWSRIHLSSPVHVARDVAAARRQPAHGLGHAPGRGRQHGQPLGGEDYTADTGVGFVSAVGVGATTWDDVMVASGDRRSSTPSLPCRGRAAYNRRHPGSLAVPNPTCASIVRPPAARRTGPRRGRGFRDSDARRAGLRQQYDQPGGRRRCRGRDPREGQWRQPPRQLCVRDIVAKQRLATEQQIAADTNGLAGAMALARTGSFALKRQGRRRRTAGPAARAFPCFPPVHCQSQGVVNVPQPCVSFRGGPPMEERSHAAREKWSPTVL